MESYSIDLRKKVLAAYDRGKQTQEIAEMFGVSKAWARRVKQRRRDHGELAPRPRIGKHPVKVDRDRLARLVEQQPDATLSELRDKLGVECSISAVWRALRDLGLSFKKRPSTPRNRTARMSPSDAAIGPLGAPGSTRAD